MAFLASEWSAQRLNLSCLPTRDTDQDVMLACTEVGHTVWLKPDDPRAILYSEERAFHLTGNRVMNVPVGHFRIHWSRELANAIHALAVDGAAEVNWLTTWQPYCDRILDPCWAGITRSSTPSSGMTQ